MKCHFCNKNVIESKGKMFVKTTGEIFYFCSSKCEKNFMMGRDPKKLKWTRKK
ncbi:MAG: 50S ribosomal protein L24e [Candidatus Aenigmatarchaeota archaeon]